MQIVFQRSLEVSTATWEARALGTGIHLANLVEQPDGTVEIASIDGTYSLIRANLTAAQIYMRARYEEAQVEIRALTAFEVQRLESVIANEEKCMAAGKSFSEYEMEQEGLYILGVGHYRAGYDAGNV